MASHGGTSHGSRGPSMDLGPSVEADTEGGKSPSGVKADTLWRMLSVYRERIPATRAT